MSARKATKANEIHYSVIIEDDGAPPAFVRPEIGGWMMHTLQPGYRWEEKYARN